MTPTIIIDPAFKALIPALSADEHATLTANIIEAGRARDPLATWNGVLLDGHNRHAICTEHNLPFTTSPVDGITDRADAQIWIIRHQFGRRNLSAFTRIELAVKLEPLVAAKHKAAQVAAGGDKVSEAVRAVVPTLAQAVPSVTSPAPKIPATAKKAEPAKTRTEVAKAAGVSHGTLDKGKVIIAKASEDVKAKLRAGTTTVDREFKAITGAERKATQVEAVKGASLPTGKYAVIVADPPWTYGARADDITHRAANPYPSMSIEAICEMPVMGMAADDAILWLWTTNAHIFEAADVASAWGFQVKTILTWAKDRMGTGEWLRGQTEHCLMCVRGKPVVTLTNQTTLLHGPMREHSRKPDEFYAMVEALCPVPAGGRVELFSRQARAGWVGAGAEVSKFEKAA